MGRGQIPARVHSMEKIGYTKIAPDRAALVLIGETPKRHELNKGAVIFCLLEAREHSKPRLVPLVHVLWFRP